MTISTGAGRPGEVVFDFPAEMRGRKKSFRIDEARGALVTVTAKLISGSFNGKLTARFRELERASVSLPKPSLIPQVEPRPLQVAPRRDSSRTAICSQEDVKQLAQRLVDPLTANLAVKSEVPIYAGGPKTHPVPRGEANEYHGRGYERRGLLHPNDLANSSSYIEVDRSLKTELLSGLIEGASNDVTGFVYSKVIDERISESAKLKGLIFSSACRKPGTRDAYGLGDEVPLSITAMRKPNSMEQATFDQITARLQHQSLGRKLLSGGRPTIHECGDDNKWVEVNFFIKEYRDAHPQLVARAEEELERVCRCANAQRVNLHVSDSGGKTFLRFHSGWFLERVTDREADRDFEGVAGLREQVIFNIKTIFTEDVIYKNPVTDPQLYVHAYDVMTEPPHAPAADWGRDLFLSHSGGREDDELRNDCARRATGTTQEVRDQISRGGRCTDHLRAAMLLAAEARYPGPWNSEINDWERAMMSECRVEPGARIRCAGSRESCYDGFVRVQTGAVMRTPAEVDREMSGCYKTIRAAKYRGAIPRCFPKCSFTDLANAPPVPPVVPRAMIAEQNLIASNELELHSNRTTHIWPYYPFLNARLQLRPTVDPVPMKIYYRYDLTDTRAHSEYWEEDPLHAELAIDVDVLVSPFGYTTVQGAAAGIELASEPRNVRVENIGSLADQLCDNLTGWVGVWFADAVGIFDCRQMILDEAKSVPSIIAREIPWILSGAVYGAWTDNREQTIKDILREIGNQAIDSLNRDSVLGPLIDEEKMKSCLSAKLENSRTNCVFEEVGQ